MLEFGQAIAALIFYFTNDKKVISLATLMSLALNSARVSQEKKIATFNATLDILSAMNPSYASSFSSQILSSVTKQYNKNVRTIFKNFKNVAFSKKKINALNDFLTQQFERQTIVPQSVKDAIKNNDLTNLVKYLKEEAKKQEIRAKIMAAQWGDINATSEDFMALSFLYRVERSASRIQNVNIIRVEDEDKSTTMTTNGKFEKITFHGSSWLVACNYDYVTKEAHFILKTGKVIYTFYNVPRIAIYMVQKMNGRAMWNGFGFNYSLNPFNWIRHGSFLFYEKRTGQISSRNKEDINYNVRKKMEKWKSSRHKS